MTDTDLQGGIRRIIDLIDTATGKYTAIPESKRGRLICGEFAALISIAADMSDSLRGIERQLKAIADAEKKGGELADILTAFHEKEGE